MYDRLARRLLVFAFGSQSEFWLLRAMQPMYGTETLHPESGPRGGALDDAWPRTPVAHLAYETDNHFATIHCSHH